MSRETDRLIADRGHGRSLRQREVLRGIPATLPARELGPEDRAECAEEARMKRLEDR